MYTLQFCHPRLNYWSLIIYTCQNYIQKWNKINYRLQRHKIYFPPIHIDISVHTISLICSTTPFMLFLYSYNTKIHLPYDLFCLPLTVSTLESTFWFELSDINTILIEYLLLLFVLFINNLKTKKQKAFSVSERTAFFQNILSR